MGTTARTHGPFSMPASLWPCVLSRVEFLKSWGSALLPSTSSLLPPAAEGIPGAGAGNHPPLSLSRLHSHLLEPPSAVPEVPWDSLPLLPLLSPPSLPSPHCHLPPESTLSLALVFASLSLCRVVSILVFLPALRTLGFSSSVAFAEWSPSGCLDCGPHPPL